MGPGICAEWAGELFGRGQLSVRCRPGGVSTFLRRLEETFAPPGRENPPQGQPKTSPTVQLTGFDSTAGLTASADGCAPSPVQEPDASRLAGSTIDRSSLGRPDQRARRPAPLIRFALRAVSRPGECNTPQSMSRDRRAAATQHDQAVATLANNSASNHKPSARPMHTRHGDTVRGTRGAGTRGTRTPGTRTRSATARSTSMRGTGMRACGDVST